MQGGDQFSGEYPKTINGNAKRLPETLNADQSKACLSLGST